MAAMRGTTSLPDQLRPTTRERLARGGVDLAGMDAVLLTRSGLLKPGCLRLRGLEEFGAEALPEHLVCLARAVSAALQSQVEVIFNGLRHDPLAANGLDVHRVEAGRLLRLATEEGYRFGRFVLGTHDAADERVSHSDLEVLLSLLTDDGDHDTYLDDLLGEAVQAVVGSLADDIAVLESRPLSRVGKRQDRLAKYDVLVSFGLAIAVSEFEITRIEADSLPLPSPKPECLTSGSGVTQSRSEAGQLGRPFCRACGGALLSPHAAERCPRCDEVVVSSRDDHSSHVGRTVSFRAGLRHKTGLVVAESKTQTTVTVLVDGKSTTIQTHQLKEVSPEEDFATASPAYRLILAAHRAHGEQRDRILEHLADVLTTVSARRTFALAAFQHADANSIRQHSGLSQTEKAWLLMWMAHNLGDSHAAMEHLSQLPTDGYPDKIGVIAAHWAVASQAPARTVVIEHLKGIPDDALATALLFALGEHRWDDVRQAVASIPAFVAGVRLEGPSLRGLRMFGGCEASTAASPDDLSPNASIVLALRSGSWPHDEPFLSDDSQEAASSWERSIAGAAIAAGEAVVDSLIDAGLLGRRFLATAETAGHCDPAYLRARILPQELSNDELIAAGHVAETARRTFLAGETPTGSTEETRLYALLTALRAGDATVLAELVPMLPDHSRKVALALGRSLRDGSIDVEVITDRSTWPVIAHLLPTGDELSLAHPDVKRLSEWWSLKQAQQRLFEWDWQAAATAARLCLRTAQDEGVRDEALNLLAAALYQSGNMEGARRALEDALAGVDSSELIINYGIVVGENDKHAASTELGRLAVEAPTLQLRLTAARRALALWNDYLPGDGETDEPPPSLISAMRALSVEATGLDEHVGILRFLSWADSEWLADERHTRGSPYGDAPRHTYLVARAKGPKEAVAQLARICRIQPEDEWFASERERLVEGLITSMLESEQPLLGSAMWALEIMDAGLDLEARQRILLPVLAVREFALYMMRDESWDGAPKLELLDRVITARTLLAAQPDLDADAYGRLIDETVERFAFAGWRGWALEHDAIVDAYNAVLSRLSGTMRWQVNRVAVRQATDPMLSALSQIEQSIRRVLDQGIKNVELTNGLQGIVRSAGEIRQAILKLPR